MQKQELEQQPRNALTRSGFRKRPWYERALGCLHLWVQPAVVPPPPPAVDRERRRWGLRWCSSLKAAAAAARRSAACLSFPACYEPMMLGVHVDAVVPVPRRTTESGRCSAGFE